MGTILSAILDYWVVWVCGIVAGGVTFFFKKFFKMYKKEKEDERQKTINDLEAKNQEVLKEVEKAMILGRDESKEDDKVLQDQINAIGVNLNSLKAGLLSMQGKEFKENCRRLLAEDHEITLEEWEEIDMDHDAYNGLGGNHNGDHLFALVKQKAENTLTDSNK